MSAATNDIDTFDSIGQELRDAAERARLATGLPITIGDSSVAQFPRGYEDRLVRALPDLRNLEIFVLERHDLAASKLLRGNQHDRQQLAELHDRAPLDIETLNDRFDELLLDVIGDSARVEARWARYHFIGEVWGELEADDVRPRP